MGNFCGKCGQKLDEKTGLCPQCDKGAFDNKAKRQKSCKIVITLLCCISIIVAGLFGILRFLNNETVHNTNGEYNSFTEGFTDVLVTDEKSAIEAVGSVGDILGVTDAEEELKVISVNCVNTDNYYRMQQYYRDIPVYGNTVVVSASDSGEALALTSNYNKINTDFNIEPSLSQKQATESLREFWGNQTIKVPTLDSAELIIYDDNGNSVLAYLLRVSANNNYNDVIMDANNGDILLVQPLIYNDSVTVVSKNGQKETIGWQNIDGSHCLYNDEYKITMFDLRGVNTSGDTQVDFKKYGTQPMSSQTNVFDDTAMTFFSNSIKTAEFYSKLGDAGFYSMHIGFNEQCNWPDNAAGGGIKDSNNRYGIIYIGENYTEDQVDVLAHKYTHAVSGSIIGWGGSKNEQTAAINEGYSDIFGELVEEYISGDINWEHGNRIIHSPSTKKYPETINDEYNGEQDYAHAYSTVISHAAYLMWNGINGNSEMKIDSEHLAELWYRSLLLLQSDADYSQCANFLLISATQMVRDGQLTTMQFKCVREALYKVDILNDQNYPTVLSGAELIVKDIMLNEYNDYHITITEISDLKSYLKNKTSGTIVVDEDVKTTSAYTLNLKDGLYSISVQDNFVDGSKNQYSEVVKIQKATPLNTYSLATKSFVIYTDFGSKYNETNGNLSNGGKVAKFSDGLFYINEANNSQDTLYRLDTTTGKSVEIFSTQYIDSLSIQEDYVYYRYGKQNDSASYLCKMRLDGSERKDILTEWFYAPVVSEEWIYYMEYGAVCRCSLEGTNKQKIMTFGSDMLTSFCIVDDYIFYIEPINFATGGFYYGPLCRVNLDGSNKMVIIDDNICNDRLFSNGEWLFFNQSDTKRCRLDGSEITSISGYYENNINANAEYIVLNSDSLNKINLNNGSITEIVPNVSTTNIYLIDEWIYYVTASNKCIFKVKDDGSQHQQVGVVNNNHASSGIEMSDYFDQNGFLIKGRDLANLVGAESNGSESGIISYWGDSNETYIASKESDDHLYDITWYRSDIMILGCKTGDFYDSAISCIEDAGFILDEQSSRKSAKCFTKGNMSLWLYLELGNNTVRGFMLKDMTGFE